MAKAKNLFGSLLEKEDMYKASTIVEELNKTIPARNPFLCTSPSMSWSTVNGFQYGAMELMYGPKSSGKTMIALDRIKNVLAQDPDNIAIFVDAEMGFEFDSTIAWMKANGVDAERVLILREVNIKTIFEKKILGEIQTSVEKEGVKLGCIVFDSIQAMAVKDTDVKEASKGDLTKNDYGARANYLSRIFPFYRQFVRNYRIYSVFIGQARSDGQDMRGNELFKTNGGEALFHEVNLRYIITRDTSKDDNIYSDTAKDINGNPVKIGHRVKFICEKNKLGEGLDRRGYIDIVYMKGVVNTQEEIVELAKNLGLIQLDGSWYTYKGKRYHGSKQVAELLNDPLEYQELFNLVMLDAGNNQKFVTGSKKEGKK